MAEKNTIARPYAEAIFAVARDNNTLGELSEALNTAGALMEDGRVAEFLGTPTLTDARRLEFLQGLFAEAMGKGTVLAGGSQHGTNFLKLLIENDRIDVLPEIAQHFDDLKDAVENTIDVTVRSASALSDADRREYVTALEKRFGRKVELSTEIDEDLIGGAVIRAGDVVIDGSLRARLEGLANALVK
jgi:F-type H+-transporting ATPase subunit delta